MKIQIKIEETNKHTDGKVLFDKVKEMDFMGWSINDPDHRVRFMSLSAPTKYQGLLQDIDAILNIQVTPDSLVFWRNEFEKIKSICIHKATPELRQVLIEEEAEASVRERMASLSKEYINQLAK